MTALERALVLALLAQMTTTFVLGLRLAYLRAAAAKAGTIRGDVRLSPEGWPPRERAASNNFSNQFELPVLFYALGLLAPWAKSVGPVLVAGAWVFVASRVVHAVVHCGSNDLRFRRPAYFVGVVALAVMLVDVAAAVVAG